MAGGQGRQVSVGGACVCGCGWVGVGEVFVCVCVCVNWFAVVFLTISTPDCYIESY